ncbi:centromere protein H-like [Saccoglossus kowalevskii]|uniref:Centromere protein H-like n=1 Tax=Saccoglossus kowalevskii TaxID=10224 RepID=A0ABM0GJY3_SACKO|nr:PREDICTED: centromere protein H-like [Saccoglossus kowalevskii]
MNTSHNVLENETNEDDTAEADLNVHKLLLKKKRYKEWLEHQKAAHEVLCEYKRSVSSTDDLDELGEKIASLQTHSLKVSENHAAEEFQLQSVLDSCMLEEALLPADECEDFDESEQKVIIEMAEKQFNLSQKILKENKEMAALRAELDECTKQSFDINKTNQEAVARLQQMKENRGDNTDDAVASDDLKRVKEELEELRVNTELVRGIFQGIIVGSGINWAEDDKLSKTVISLGKPFDP